MASQTKKITESVPRHHPYPHPGHRRTRVLSFQSLHHRRLLARRASWPRARRSMVRHRSRPRARAASGLDSAIAPFSRRGVVVVTAVSHLHSREVFSGFRTDHSRISPAHLQTPAGDDRHGSKPALHKKQLCRDSCKHGQPRLLTYASSITTHCENHEGCVRLTP